MGSLLHPDGYRDQEREPGKTSPSAMRGLFVKPTLVDPTDDCHPTASV